MGYKVPSLTTASPEWEAYALEVLAGVLDGGNSARLSTDLVRGKQIAVSASASYSLTMRLPTLFELEATPAEGKTVADLEKALKAHVTRLQNQLVGTEELQRIKAQVLASAVYERDSGFTKPCKSAYWKPSAWAGKKPMSMSLKSTKSPPNRCAMWHANT